MEQFINECLCADMEAEKISSLIRQIKRKRQYGQLHVAGERKDGLCVRDIKPKDKVICVYPELRR